MAIQLNYQLPPAGAATNRKTQFALDALTALINANFVSTTATGAANRLAYYSAADTIGPLAAITASRALASDANGLPVAATTTATELGYVNGVTSAIQTQLTGKASTTLNNLGTTAANATIGPSSSNSIDLGTTSALWRNIYGVQIKAGASGTQGQVDVFPSTSAKGKLTILKAANTNDDATVINVAAQSDAYTYTVIDAGASSSFVMTAAAQTIGGQKTFSSTTLFANAAVGTPNGFSGDTDNGFYYIGTNNWGLAAAGTKCVDIKSTGVAILGTNTNDNAAAGFVGQSVKSVVSAVTLAATTVYGNITSISLTAGDWLVWGQLNIASADGAAVTRTQIVISEHSGNTTTDHVGGDNLLDMGFSWTSGATRIGGSCNAYRVSTSSTKTIYLKARADYSGGTLSTDARLSALRIR